MDKRTAKGPKAKARKTVPKGIRSGKERLQAMENALEEGASNFTRWIRKEIPAVRARFATIGKTVVDTATAIEEELRDDVAGVKRRLAAKKEAAPARKPAARKPGAKKPAKKPAARRKATARKTAPARSKAATRQKPAKRTATRKRAASRSKSARAPK